MTRLYCTDCLEETEAVEETFDYAGTHCTHGRGGTEHTGHFVSKCCGAELYLRDLRRLAGTGASIRVCLKQIEEIEEDEDNWWALGKDMDDGDDWDAERRENAELEGDDERGELL